MSNEPIAVIGIGCRVPGADNIREFWRVLLKGENHVVEVPRDRWDVEEVYSPDPDAPGKTYSRRAGFIKNYDHFDNKLFGINESEAAQMDPQQRQVLECTYMALENAGITRQEIAGKNVGVFIGCMNSDFSLRMSGQSHTMDNYTVAGISASIISNRVSYVYHLTGPSMTIDTACSSSLVAIHQAANAIRAGDCIMSICGGVNMMLHPSVFVPLSKARMLSPTGQCHAFSDKADGYTRGEGCGIVILKPLAQALKDNDNIWGTIVTGLNQDGRAAQPITAPSESQQANLLDFVYTKYNIDPSTVDYIEAHGTGTKKGDPIEIGTFGKFFNKKDSKQRYLGSVKTNIGHLESAAGVAGLIKVLLMMKHNTIVPSLHFERPNKEIDLDKFHFVVPTKPVTWKAPTMVACLNSFGFGGANSHAVVTKYISPDVKQCEDESPVIVPFSGSTAAALTKSLQDYLASETDGYSFRTITYTSCLKREHFPVRKAFLAHSKSALRDQIEEFLLKGNVPNAVSGGRRLIFVFCGMGTAWKGMCKEQLQKCKECKSWMMQMDTSLKRFVSWSLIERLEKSFSVEDPEFGPIAIFACQVALAKLWISWGVNPVAVVGQSVGEVAAAHIAGVLSLDEAVRVIYQRSKVLANAMGGKMLLVRKLDVQEVKTVCDKYAGKADIALYYSPISCSVSGDPDAVDGIRSELQEKYLDQGSGTILTELPVTSAFHSHHMEASKLELETMLKDLKTHQPSVEWISTVDVQMDSAGLQLPGYWGMNLRQPVYFSNAIRKAAVDEKLNVFLEIGPRPVLQAHMKDIFKDMDVVTSSLPSLVANGTQDDLQRTLVSIYELNISINWASMFPDKMIPSSVPRHGFAHKPLTVLSDSVEETAVVSVNTTGNHLYVKKSATENKCKLNITPSTLSTIYEHKIKGTIVVPGATYAETGFGILQVLNICSPFSVSVSVGFSTPVTLKGGHPSSLSIDLTLPEDRTFKEEMLFLVRNGERIHAEGRILKTRNVLAEDRIDMKSIQDRCRDEVSSEDVYQTLGFSGLTYGDSFATIDYAFRGKGESLAKLKLSPMLRKEMEHTVLHPAILDGMLQTAAATEFEEKEFLPTELKNVTVKRHVEDDMYAHSRLIEKTDSNSSFALTLLSPDGSIIATVAQFSIKYIGKQQFDERSITFQPNLKSLGKVEMQKGIDQNMKLFTDLNLTYLHFPCKIIPLDQIRQNGHKIDVEAILQDTSQICFLFPVSQLTTDSGDPLQEELIKRIVPLRLVMLHLATRGSSMPLIIVTETRGSDSSTGSESAALCLREAIKGFVRCVIREHRSLRIQMVDICVEEEWELTSNLMTVLSNITSDTIKDYPEVTYRKLFLYADEILPNTAESPLYRNTNYSQGTNAVLCTRSVNVVSAPFLVPTDEILAAVKKDDVAVEVSISTIHSPVLYGVTMKSKQKSSETDLYPVLSFERTGSISSKTGEKDDYVSCFPTPVKKSVVVPRKCLIAKKAIPGYSPGSLTKLYTLWCMCDAGDVTSVAILYLPDTEALAQALSVLLLSRGSRSVSLLTPSELLALTTCQHLTLISTVQMTTNLTEKLSHSLNFQNIVCIDNITKKSTIEHLTALSTSVHVHILRPAEMFSPKAMQEAVPRMLKWVKVQSRKMQQLESLFESSLSVDLSDDVQPINIAELLHMSEVTLTNDNGLDHKNLRIPSSHLFQRSGTYLVVGGLTGLGWECVSFLASQGAGCIAILSRSKPKQERQTDMNMLTEKFGCSIVSIQADVTKYNDVNQALMKLRRHCPTQPLKGVFFGAAVLADSSLVDMTEDMIRKVTAPKVIGAWNFHVLLADVPLDYFVMHSSVASLTGNAGQSNYGAGNGFMDGLAISRQRCKLSGQSINWGPLNLGLLDDNKYLVKRLEAKGSLPIEKKDIGQCLKHVLMLNKPQILMCRIDRQKMAEQLRRDNEKALLVRLELYLDPVFKVLDARKGVAMTQNMSFSLDQLYGASPAEKTKMIKDYLKHLICDKALLDENTFDVNESLKDQGVDSMYAMEISGQILAETKVKLSANELSLGTVTSITKYIMERLHTTDNIPQEVPTDERYMVSKQTINDSIERSVFTQASDGKRDLVTISTIRVPDVADDAVLKQMAKESIARHKTARTSYKINNNHISRDSLEVDQALDFRTVSEGEDDLLQQYTDEPLDTMSKGPLRFIYIRHKSQLKLIFHRVAFDFQGITLMIREFQRFAVELSNGLPLDKISKDSDPDAAEEIQKTLSHSYEKLRLFWGQKVQHICYSSLVQPLSTKMSNEATPCVQETMTSELYKQTMHFVRENHLSPFQFLSSIFQLLLALVSNKSASTILIPVDLRVHVPTLARFVGRCTNYIPLICDISNDKMTMEDFLLKNRSSTEGFIKYGLFPFEELQELLSDEQKKHLYRNYFIFEEDMVTSHQHNAEVDISVSFGPYTESFMFVWHRKTLESLEIKLYLKRDLFSQAWSETIMDVFKEMMSQTVKHPSLTLAQMKHKLHKMATKNGNLRNPKKHSSSSVCSLM